MKHLFLRRSELVSIGVALVLLLAIAVYSGLDWVGYRQNRTDVQASRQVFEDTSTLLMDITAAESAERGYLLTGNKQHLEPYDRALQEVPSVLDRLDQETMDNAALHKRFAALRDLVNRKLSVLHQNIELRKGNDPRAGMEEPSPQAGDDLPGNALMESIRQLSGALRKDLSERIDSRSALVRSNSDRSHLTAVFGSTVLLVLLALAVVNIGRAAERREQLIAALDRQRELASRVRDLLKTTLFSIGDAVLVTDRHGRVTYLNRVAEALTGWSETDAAKRPAAEVFGIVDDANREPLKNPVERVLEERTAAPSVDHAILIAKDGRETPIEDNGAPIITPAGELLGVVLVFRDVTSRRAAEREKERLLRETQRSRLDAERQRSHLYSLFRQAPASINIYRGPDHIFELLHPLAMQFFGGRDLTGLSARDFHRDAVIKMMDEVYQSGEPRFLHEYRLRAADESSGVEELYVNYLCCLWKEADESVAGVMTLAVDVTEQVRIKQAMAATEERLRETAKLESLGVLAGGIAHDFNNLLVGIMGNATLALETISGDDSAREMLEGVVKASERAAVLTRQMLAYSGKGRFVIEQVDVSELVQEMLPLLSGSIPRTITLQTELSADVPEVEADSAQIQQVFMNLVINAAEACDGKSGTVTVRTSREEVADEVEGQRANTFGLPVLQPGTYVALEVSDMGSGMDEETKAKIFDPFFTTKFTGRGLGLSAVLGIIRSHKGGIYVSSAPGRGSTFRVLFPSAEEHFVRLTKPAKAVTGHEGSGTVLMIDDEDLVRRMARSTLERYGYTVTEAENGQRAVQIFREKYREIGVVILDLTMPVMSGEETLIELRRMRPDVAIVLSSGFSEGEATLRFAGRDLSGFLQKPYTALQLAAVVTRASKAVQPFTLQLSE